MAQFSGFPWFTDIVLHSSSHNFQPSPPGPTSHLQQDGVRRIGHAIELEAPQVLVAFSWGAALAMHLMAVPRQISDMIQCGIIIETIHDWEWFIPTDL